jgi:hypothetical protein
MFRAILVWATLAGLVSAGQLGALQSVDARLARLSQLVNADPRSLNLEREEIQYQEDVQRQTLADLAEVYSP